MLTLTGDEKYGPKIGDLRTLFLNAHHLLNEYRPHQARESLALRMEEQLERSRAETAAIRAAVARVDAVLDGLKTSLDAAGAAAPAPPTTALAPAIASASATATATASDPLKPASTSPPLAKADARASSAVSSRDERELQRVWAQLRAELG